MCKNLLDEVIAPPRTSKDVIIAKKGNKVGGLTWDPSYRLKPPKCYLKPSNRTLQHIYKVWWAYDNKWEVGDLIQKGGEDSRYSPSGLQTSRDVWDTWNSLLKITKRGANTNIIRSYH